jgi:hypothetical protein
MFMSIKYILNIEEDTMLGKGLFLISLIGFFGVIAILTLANPENVYAFRPTGPTEAAPIQPSEQPETTTQVSPPPMAATSSLPLVNYENSTFGMRISYPWNWTKYESHDGSTPLIVRFTDKPAVSSYEEIQSLGVVNITGRPVTLNASSNDMSLYLQERLNDSMTTLPFFNLIETRSTTINAYQQNIPATMTLYSYQDPVHNEVYVLTIDILKDGRLYLLEYSAEPERYFKNSQILMEMVDSFEITQAPNTTMVIPPSTNFKTYENSDLGISIKYPDNWIYEERENYVDFDFPMGAVTVAADNTIFPSSQQALINFTSYGLKNISGFDLIQFEPVDLRGVNSTSSDLRVFTKNSGLGSIYKVTQIVTVFGGKIYFIDILADPAVYPIFEPTFQKMIDSFQITDRPDTTAAGSPAPAPTPAPAPLLLSSKFGLDKTEDIMLENGTSYPIKYKITGGKISNMDLGGSSLIIRIDPEVFEDSYQGKLVVEIPNTVLDSNRKFIVYDNYGPTESKKLASNSNSAIVKAAFFNGEPGLRTIEIRGVG